MLYVDNDLHLFNFTFFNVTYCSNIAHFTKTCHVNEMDWVLLRMPWAGLGLQVKGWAEFEQVTRQVHEE